MRLDGRRLSDFRYMSNYFRVQTIRGSGVMTKSFLRILAMTALCAPASADAAEAIYGVWAREGHPMDKLEFFDCAGKLCAKGTLPMLDGRPAPLVLRNAAKTGPNSWKGDLFNPEDGKMYTGKITYESANELTLTGCLVAFLCQSETWNRISGPTKPAAEAKPAQESAKGAGHEPDKAHEPAKAAGHESVRPAAAKTGAAPAGAAEHKAGDHKTGDHKPADRKTVAPKAGKPE